MVCMNYKLTGDCIICGDPDMVCHQHKSKESIIINQLKETLFKAYDKTSFEKGNDELVEACHILIEYYEKPLNN